MKRYGTIEHQTGHFKTKLVVALVTPRPLTGQSPEVVAAAARLLHEGQNVTLSKQCTCFFALLLA